MKAVNENRTLLIAMASRNRLLAQEFERLPELKRAGDGKAPDGLLILVNAYLQRPAAFEKLLEAIGEVGLVRFRKFSAPLQALLWVAGSEGFDNLFCLINPQPPNAPMDVGLQAVSPNTIKTTLTCLLNRAWFREPVLFTDGEILGIIRGIRSESMWDDYCMLKSRKKAGQLQKYIFDDFQRTPEAFDPLDRQMIADNLKLTRWLCFETVRDRLNAPELLHYYLSHRLVYTLTPARGTLRTFVSRRGQCTDAAYFCRDILVRSGYRAFIRSVKWNSDPWTGLHTGAGIIRSDGRFVIVANFNGVNKTSGPHDRIEDVDLQLARGNRIIDRRWGAYYPPRSPSSPQ